MKEQSLTYNRKSRKINIILSVILFLFCATVIARCQQYTTVSGTIVDSDATTWINGSWTAQLNNPRGGGVTFIDAPGTPVVTQFSGSLSNAGAFSISGVPNNSDLAPAGTYWTFTFCPDASYQCSTLPGVAFILNQNTYDISSLATSNISSPRFPALGHQSWGYTDTEVTPVPNVGGLYFNTEINELRYWDGTQWNTIASNGTSSTIKINGTLCPNCNLNDSTPAAPAGDTNISFQLSGSSASAYIPNFTAGLQMFSSPPIVGQNILILPTSNVITKTGSASGIADNQSGQVSMDTSTTGTNIATVTWHFSVPAGINPANITAIYPLMVVEGFTSNTINSTTCAGGAGFPGSSSNFSLATFMLTSSAGTDPTSFTCSISIGGSIPFRKVGDIKVDLVAAYLYYSGTPVTQPSYTYVKAPAYYNSVLKTLGVAAINVSLQNQDGGITGLMANSNLANPSMTIDGVLCTLGGSCTTAGSSSFDILSTQKSSGTMFFYPGLEYYMTTAGVPVTIFQATGSGYISNMFIASANISNYQNSVVSCSVNGEATPSFKGTLRTLLQNAFVPSGTYVGNYFISTNQGEGNGFAMPIPYSNGIICTLTPAASSNTWVDITAHTVSDTWPYTEKLHTSTIEATNPATSNGLSFAPYTYETLVNYAGSNPGRLAGFWLLDNESGGGGKAALEGNIALYLDTFNAMWKANTAMTVGQIILDPCGNFQDVSTAGTTGSTEPTCAAIGGSVFGDVSGQTTTDGTVTYTASVGTPLNIWRASQPYILGMSFLSPDGLTVQTVTTAGTTGATQPTYCATAGCTTTDGTVVTTSSLIATMIKAAFVCTGTEDCFNLGFYGGGATAGSQGTGSMNGMTVNSNNVEGFYRYFVNDPIRFTNSIGIIRQIGDPSEVSLTFNTLQMAATYFYTQDTN